MRCDRCGVWFPPMGRERMGAPYLCPVCEDDLTIKEELDLSGLNKEERDILTAKQVKERCLS